LKKYENISIKRSILVIFLILTSMSMMFYGFSYFKTKIDYENSVKDEMELSLYKTNKKYKIIEIKYFPNMKLNELKKEGENFNLKLKKNDKYYLIQIKEKDYKKSLKEQIQELSFNYLMIFIANITIAVILSGFILEPIRRNIKLNDEFIKDILHDINTPISVIKINLNLIKRKQEINKDISKELERINIALYKISFLQNNLKDYQLERQINRKEIDLEVILKEKEYIYKSLYKDINFKIQWNARPKIITNEDIFTRILDNIISNAFKYNNKNGEVKILIYKHSIIIKDTGIGIKDTTKVFNRLYKENERGMGIGLNIVKKMINEIDMTIDIKSEIEKGTSVTIYF